VLRAAERYRHATAQELPAARVQREGVENGPAVTDQLMRAHDEIVRNVVEAIHCKRDVAHAGKQASSPAAAVQRAVQCDGLRSILDSTDGRQDAVCTQRMRTSAMAGCAANDVVAIAGDDLVEQAHVAVVWDQVRNRFALNIHDKGSMTSC